MPGFITHYICAQAVLKSASPPVQKIIEDYVNIYNLGAQGPDIFYYYLPGMLKKQIRGIGNRLHQENPGAFIMNIADAVQRADDKDKPLLFAYTAGYLTHYALDSATHPFVYARSVLSDSVKKRRGLHGSVEHRKLETSIDILILKLVSGEKPADYKLWQLIDADMRHMRTAAEAVSLAIEKTYKSYVEPKDVCNAMRCMVNLTRLLQSRKGRRKRLMELAEDLTLGARYATSLIHDQETDGKDYMNLQKATWRAPWETANGHRDHSFVELYTEAVENGQEMAEALYSFTQRKTKIAELRARIGNRSLKTGLTWQA